MCSFAELVFGDALPNHTDLRDLTPFLSSSLHSVCSSYTIYRKGCSSYSIYRKGMIQLNNYIRKFSIDPILGGPNSNENIYRSFRRHPLPTNLICRILMILFEQRQNYELYTWIFEINKADLGGVVRFQLDLRLFYTLYLSAARNCCTEVDCCLTIIWTGAASAASANK